MPNFGNKILIIGCAGSGKTTLANQLNIITKIPIIHMDNHYWTANWGRKSDAEWNEIVEKLCQQPQWIMDGNYSKTMLTRFKHASTVIYLDMPRWKCMTRVIIRRFRLFYNKRRKDIPSNCHERINLKFYLWIWNYRKKARTNTLDLLSNYSGVIYHLKSKRDITTFVNSVNILF